MENDPLDSHAARSSTQRGIDVEFEMHWYWAHIWQAEKIVEGLPTSFPKHHPDTCRSWGQNRYSCRWTFHRLVPTCTSALWLIAYISNSPITTTTRAARNWYLRASDEARLADEDLPWSLFSPADSAPGFACLSSTWMVVPDIRGVSVSVTARVSRSSSFSSGWPSLTMVSGIVSRTLWCSEDVTSLRVASGIKSLDCRDSFVSTWTSRTIKSSSVLELWPSSLPEIPFEQLYVPECRFSKQLLS